MKKVVFIGGSSHSGSTMLDLMLSSHPECFSAGEVQSLFRPSKPHHINPICGCGIRGCAVWEDIYANGEKDCYENIFHKYPEVDTIVDSSKSISWIYDQSRFLSDKNIKLFYFIIWKEPLELAISLYKRNKIKNFHSTWTNYYKNYLKIIKCPKSIKYSELAQFPDKTIESLMKILGKQSVQDQHKYWQKKHHTLFGSTSSRIHLHEPESSEYKRLCTYIQENNNRENLSSSHVRNYRCIKYTSIDLRILPNNITEKINNNKSVKKIVAELKYCNFLKDLPGGPSCSTNTIVPPVSIISEKAKKIIKATFFRSI